MADSEEIEGLADICEAIAMTLFMILRTALAHTHGDHVYTKEMKDTSNLREGARNVAYKIAKWDEVQ